MQSVKVKKDELLAIVKENRTKHEAEFNAAQEAYKVKAKAALRGQVKNIDQEKPFTLNFKELPEPKQFLKEYDRAIGMLEMSVDEIVELEDDEYDRLVKDQWHWTNQFVAATSIYNIVN